VSLSSFNEQNLHPSLFNFRSVSKYLNDAMIIKILVQENEAMPSAAFWSFSPGAP
jgi:hypothetical protein